MCRNPSWKRSGDSPGRTELDVVGSEHRELVVGHGLDAAVARAVHDGNRTTPEPLARQQPVAEPEVDGALTVALCLEPVDRRHLRVGDRQPVEEARVDVDAITRVRLAVPLVGPADRLDDREVVGGGEVPVALVLAGHGHDRARAVGAQHVVGEEHRHGLLRERVAGIGAGEAPALVDGALGRQPVDVGSAAHGLDERVDRRRDDRRW